MSLPALLYEPLLRRALEEDLGVAGDVTTTAVVAAGTDAEGRLVARAPGNVAGLQVALAAFPLVDGAVRLRACVQDGDGVAPGTVLAVVTGPARAILTAERTALNLLGHLCGVATVTRRIVDAVAPHGTRVLSTRKTTPGLRSLEKYAVRMGGGVDHRFGLDDAVLIKDNHIALAGGIRPAVDRVRGSVGPLMPVEVEVDTLAQLEEALAVDVTAVLLDNMPVEMLREAVALVGGRAVTEASGGITQQTATAVAATGVDYVSLGWLTHSAPALDIGLDLDAAPEPV